MTRIIALRVANAEFGANADTAVRAESKAMLRNAILAMLIALPLPGSAVAQPSPQPGENLGLGREFGAFDPDRSARMIRECEIQTAKLREAMVTWRATVEAYLFALDASESALKERGAAMDAVYEAEVQARALTGAQAARFEVDILQPRRERLRLANLRADEATAIFDAARKQFGDSADVTVAILRSIGLKDSEMAGSPEVIIQRQVARCERMKAWEAQGSRVRQQMREPAPISSWPDGALDGWKGAWSCHWRSTGRDGTVETDIGANASAFLEDDGTVLVHFSTEWVRLASWPNSHAKHIFSPLTVGQSQPTRGAFTNREGLGEDRAPPDAIDLGAISGDGRLRFQRRYSMQPDRQDDLECTRAR